jgi:hypothetical protein
VSAFINTEAMERAAYRMEQAVSSANQVADRMESALHQLRILTEDGYGNNVSRLIELLIQDAARKETQP